MNHPEPSYPTPGMGKQVVSLSGVRIGVVTSVGHRSFGVQTAQGEIMVMLHAVYSVEGQVVRLECESGALGRYRPDRS